MITKLLKKIKDIYVEYLLNRQLNKALAASGTQDNRLDAFSLDFKRAVHSDSSTILEEKEVKYLNGIKLLKQRVLNSANGDIDSFLRNNSEMLTFSEIDDPEMLEVIRSRLKVIAHNGKDIKTDQDKKDMIDRRINIMYNVQRDKLKRKLAREIREASRSGNKDLEKKLIEEYNVKYSR
jgi:hypothetical protein